MRTYIHIYNLYIYDLYIWRENLYIEREPIYIYCQPPAGGLIHPKCVENTLVRGGVGT